MKHRNLIRVSRPKKGAAKRHLAEQLEWRRLLSNPAFYAGDVYAAGEGASTVIAADLNYDGKPDLITANYKQSNVSVLLNNGNGTFGAHTDYAVGQNPVALAAVDLNRDGSPDLISANADDNTISVLNNNGQGQFNQKTDYASGVHPNSIAAADFTGDGRPDIAVANGGDKNIRIFKNLGNGSFTPLADIPFDGGAVTVVAADLNNDHRADLAVTFSYPSEEVRLLLGNGDGTFTSGNRYATSHYPQAVFVADMDHNGAMDLVIGSGYDQVNVYLNDGNAVLTPSANYYVSWDSAANPEFTFGDFNGDGYIDVASTFTGHSYLSTPTVLLNRHDGTLSEPIDVSFARGGALASADVNGDGLSDIVAGSAYLSPDVSVAVSINAGTSFFGQRSFYDGDTRPYGVIPGDFNNDGRMDLFVQGSTVGSHVEVQNADGTFSPSKTLRTDGYVLAVADFNHDGWLDPISASDGIGIQLNNGDGTFGSFTSLFPTPQFYSPGGTVAVGDFNGDGKPDLAANEWGSTVIQVRMNLGNGTFGPVSQYTGQGPMIAAELTGDTKIDLAVWTPTGLQILRNTGNGTFVYGAITPVASGEMIAGDFDLNTTTDLAIASSDGLFLLRNYEGDTGFTVSKISAGNFSYENLTEGDFNGDGTLDLATPGAVYLNKGLGNFDQPIGFPVGEYAMGVASADFNNDGRPDLAWANLYSNSISVILNDYVRTDIAAPSAPDLVSSYDTGRSDTDNITNATVPLFYGSGGERGMTVILYLDGAEAGRTCVGTYGDWSLSAGVLRPGRHVLTARQTNAFGSSPLSSPLTITIDTTVPTVTSGSFDFMHAPHTATIGYSEDVSWSLSASDFQLTNLTSGATFTLAHSYYSGKSHVQSIASAILPDGNYTLRVKSAGVMDIAGNALPADYILSFFVFGGDVNRDRKIDATDLGVLSANWQGIYKTYSQGDFNYDGKVDINDLYILASKWQQTLAPPPPVVTPIGISGPAPTRTATRVVNLIQ